MEPEQIIFIAFGIAALLCGVGLSLVKINKEELSGKIHTMPGMSLFRFPAYRWGAVAIFGVLGIFSISLGYGWL